jgi:hypothetical protein
MTSGTVLAAQASGDQLRPMRFTVDAWDPSYGTSLGTEDSLEESTANVQLDLELPASRWHAIDAPAGRPAPGAMLFVDGVRRIEAHLWIDDDPQAAGPHGDDGPGPATAALCASYAAGVVCCCGPRAHLAAAEIRRGLFSVAPHASDIVTRAGRYQAHPVAAGPAGVPLMASLSQALQRRLADVEMAAAAAARAAIGDHGQATVDDLLIIDGPLRGRQHLPRALGYIKSHRATYLPPDLNALVGMLSAGQRTPVFRMGTSWERHSWYLRLPGSTGSPWSGVVRIECAADLPVAEVIRLAGLSQASLGRFASASYKDGRAPQNLYPIGGLERELRHRLGDPQLLYRGLREAARALPDPVAAG